MITDYIPIKDTYNEFKKQTLLAIITAITLVIGLSWNNAIQDTINYYVPTKYQTGANIWYKFLYASILTIILVILIVVVTKIFGGKLP